MRIGTLGAGLMTEALVPHWIAAGHEVLVGGRDQAHAHELGDRLGVEHGSLADAADFGEVVLLAVHSEGLVECLGQAGAARGTLSRSVIIDCGNAVHLSDYSQVRWDGRSLAEQTEFLAQGGRVVKAFNMCHHSVWAAAPTYGGRRLQMPYCGSEPAKEKIRDLITQVGVDPVDAGDLSQARHLEAMAIVIIRALLAGAPTLSAFNLVTPDA
jgi:predicted dinucleotide-binding enzyme